MCDRQFDTLGVMIDMSRNAVMSVSALKRFLPILKKMGYNAAMLYTEDTYEVCDEAYFGYMRGRYSIEEMKDLDAFASDIGIELIPCIQTLAHVNAAIRWGTFPVDCEDIMLVDDDRTYELIGRMLGTVSECFKSRRIHIGMDEALMLGRGKHLDKHGFENAYSIMQRHIKRVKALALEHGYEIMMWSDMFFRSWNENHGYYLNKKIVMPEEFVRSYDPDIIPVYWDYYHSTEEIYDAMIYNHQQLSDKIWFAGGVWTWSGFMPQITCSLHTMLPAIRSCRKAGVRNIVFTLWGDCGGECSMFSALTGLHYLAEYARGNTDETDIKASFKRIVGANYDDFMMLEKLNDIRDERTEKPGVRVNPSKYMLYSDCFNGYLDYTVTLGDGAHFSALKNEFQRIKRKNRRYAYLFATAEKLCEVLEVKYELGVKTRLAYQSSDREMLRSLAENEYKIAIKAMREFGNVYEKQWFTDNKPQGFDIQDLRIGGATRRLQACRKRLIDYANGKICSIPELEEKILPYPNAVEGEPIHLMVFEKIFSANVAE